ncbi:Uncharacterised protein [Vibrio cholerae]|nr:Uncharacterised protein [Vibrio cholerae]
MNPSRWRVCLSMPWKVIWRNSSRWENRLRSANRLAIQPPAKAPLSAKWCGL